VHAAADQDSTDLTKCIDFVRQHAARQGLDLRQLTLVALGKLVARFAAHFLHIKQPEEGCLPATPHIMARQKHLSAQRAQSSPNQAFQTTKPCVVQVLLAAGWTTPCPASQPCTPVET
jgi:thiamine pyrophosphokinase